LTNTIIMKNKNTYIFKPNQSQTHQIAIIGYRKSS